MPSRLKPDVLQADQDALAALQNIGNYAPVNATYARPALNAAETAMTRAQAAEAQAQAALAAARDTAQAAEAAFHNLMLGAKDQIIAQFGRDSNEAQAVGLKKKSERKAPTRRPRPATP